MPYPNIGETHSSTCNRKTSSANRQIQKLKRYFDAIAEEIKTGITIRKATEIWGCSVHNTETVFRAMRDLDLVYKDDSQRPHVWRLGDCAEEFLKISVASSE